MDSAKELAIQLIRHDALYRSGRAKISDAEFEDLKRSLIKIDPNHPALRQLTEEVVLQGLDTPLLHEWYEEINRGFRRSAQVVVQPKFHGCAIQLKYIDGFLKAAYTRKGKDKLYAILSVKNIPSTIPQKGEVSIRGELYGLGFSPETSQRLAAGHLRKKDPTGDGLVFAGFEIVGTRLDEIEQSKQLSKWGFHTLDTLRVKGKVIEVVKAIHERWKDSLVFAKYPTDGIVIKVEHRAIATEINSDSSKP